MRIQFPILFVALSLIWTSCSEKSTTVASGKSEKSVGDQSQQEAAPNANEAEENDRAPDSDQIGEDCVAFLRATRAVPAKRDSGACPECPTSDNDPEVLQFVSFKIKKITGGEESCRADVVIQAQFNPSSGGIVAGGLVGWIPLAERKDYALGKTPSGARTYKVGVVYKREGGVWRPIEFDQAE